jgi:hypothetical protein
MKFFGRHRAKALNLLLLLAFYALVTGFGSCYGSGKPI